MLQKLKCKQILISISIIFCTGISISAQSLPHAITSQNIDPTLLKSPEAQQAINNYKNKQKTISPKKTSLSKDLILNKKNISEKDKEPPPTKGKKKTTNSTSSHLEKSLNNSKENSNLNTPKIYIQNENYFDVDIKKLEINPDQLTQFGYNIFNQDLAISTDTLIPVADDYILGPGDSLIIHIWGKIDQTLNVTLDSNGKIYIPKIGNIFLSGSTFKQSKKLIKKSLGKHYVNFDLSITMGQLKTIKVFILGETKNPGAYDIYSLSTLFNALHASGGPKKTGSLRRIKLKRNKKTYKTIDLYKYLLEGNNADDPLLRNYDTIFIPSIGKTVAISGDVKRPGIYEIKDKTTLHELIFTISGGLWQTANTKRITITRIMKNKTIKQFDIGLYTKKDIQNSKKFKLNNNDKIIIKSINEKTENNVKIIGQVKYPGTYELNKNKTLKQLIESAGSLLEDSNIKKIEIYRFISNTQREVIYIDGSKENIIETTKLNDNDIIKIYPIRHKIVSIEGGVYYPGNYKLLTNMTLTDLIQLADPIEYSAPTAELYRKLPSGEDNIVNFNYKNLLKSPNSTENILLISNDKVFIRQTPRQVKTRVITIEGEVNMPGIYYAKENETLESILNRAGGFRKTAFINGLEFYRETLKEKEIIGMNFFLENEQKKLLFNPAVHKTAEMQNNQNLRALEFMKTQAEKADGRMIIENINELKDIIIQDGDKLIVPQKINEITIIGGVLTPRGVFFKHGEKRNYYINKAGGLSDFADKKRIFIFKANGTIKKGKTTIDPGDTIYVAEKTKPQKSNFEIANETLRFITNILSPILLIQTATK